MGIDEAALEYLVDIHARFGPFGRTATLGRPGLGVSDQRLRAIVPNGGHLAAGVDVERLLLDHFGATAVDAIGPADGGRSMAAHDLNDPLPPELRGQYDTVLDLGSCERALDALQCLANAALLLRPGGQVVHVSAATNLCGRGFWQFSPDLFFAIHAPANGFEAVEVWVAEPSSPTLRYAVPPPEPGRRNEPTASNPLYVLARATVGTSALWSGPGFRRLG